MDAELFRRIKEAASKSAGKEVFRAEGSETYGQERRDARGKLMEPIKQEWQVFVSAKPPELRSSAAVEFGVITGDYYDQTNSLAPDDAIKMAEAILEAAKVAKALNAELGVVEDHCKDCNYLYTGPRVAWVCPVCNPMVP